MRRNYTHAIYFGKNCTHIKKSRQNHTHLIQITSKTYSFFTIYAQAGHTIKPLTGTVNGLPRGLSQRSGFRGITKTMT